MKVFGNRVYLKVPKTPESSIILSEEAKKKLAEDEVKKLNRLEVYAVGDLVSTIKEGNIVHIDQRVLAAAPVLELEQGVSVIIVSIFDVAHIWE